MQPTCAFVPSAPLPPMRQLLTPPPPSPVPFRLPHPLRPAVVACAAPNKSGTPPGKSEKAQFHTHVSFDRAPKTTPHLDRVAFPSDMKGFSLAELKALSNELRWDIIHAVSQTGGHLGSSLGVIELTVALHYVFNAPRDKIIWDVAHQAYPHKALTGRRSRLNTLRATGGLSGFTKRAESEYDVFGAGHSSTSISAAHGMAAARDLEVGHSSRSNHKDRFHSIAVIGDGAITGGMAYEAMNSVGYLKNRIIVIFNDNGQVSLPTGTKSAGGVRPSSALADYSARLFSSKPFLEFREAAKEFTRVFPSGIRELAAQVDEYGRSFLTMQSTGTLFEELGFYYLGPVYGHDLETLVPLLENVRDMPGDKPVLVHVKTEKGFGYAPAEQASDKLHGVGKFDVSTGRPPVATGPPKTPPPPALTKIFADALIQAAEEDPKVVAITAAMPGGTGLSFFGERFPSRCFDVGIAEQHAVTFAAGMACENYKPFCCIYSTFLQRGYDQLIHDVSIQKLPVRFILDRAGLVGNDGPTHHGTFDLAYLGCIPHLVIMAPSDEVELQNMVVTAQGIDDLPSVVRYPRGNGYGLDVLNGELGYNLDTIPARGSTLPIGKGRIVNHKSSSSDSPSVAILSIGTRLYDSCLAAKTLEAAGIPTTVADARFMKPLDRGLINRLADAHDVLITIEEGSIGGFGDHVLHYAALEGLLDDGKLKIRPMVLPDRYIEHASQKEQYEEAGLSAEHIVGTAKSLVGRGKKRSEHEEVRADSRAKKNGAAASSAQ